MSSVFLFQLNEHLKFPTNAQILLRREEGKTTQEIAFVFRGYIRCMRRILCVMFHSTLAIKTTETLR